MGRTDWVAEVEEEQGEETARSIFIFGFQFNAQLAFHTGGILLGG